ncbi:hypothetical protein C8R45DRAFT_1157073 [Mycena sanguinolenta]|nr:hypothetical protein C8R45DRAFT_1157073 [Mycena sanguinolenta]
MPEPELKELEKARWWSTGSEIIGPALAANSDAVTVFSSVMRCPLFAARYLQVISTTACWPSVPSTKKTIARLSYILLPLKMLRILIKAELELSSCLANTLSRVACRSGRARYIKFASRPSATMSRTSRVRGGCVPPGEYGMDWNRIVLWELEHILARLRTAAGYAVITVRRTDDAHRLLVQCADNNTEAHDLGASIGCALESIPTRTFASPFASTAPSSPPSSPSSPSPNSIVGLTRVGLPLKHSCCTCFPVCNVLSTICWRTEAFHHAHHPIRRSGARTRGRGKAGSAISTIHPPVEDLLVLVYALALRSPPGPR